MLVVYGSGRFMVPILYTAVVIEDKYGKRNFDWLASTYLSVIVSTSFIKQLRDISQSKDYEQRVEKLRKQRLSMVDKNNFRVLLLVISFMHVLVAVLLVWKFNWKMF